MNTSTHQRAQLCRRPSSGFTLIELLVTIAVAAVLLTIAVPSFQDMLERNRVAAQTNEVLGGLQMARSEAIRKNATHRFCSSNTGWIVRTPAVSTAIREGTLVGSATVDTYCADFRSNGLPYACTCNDATVSNTLITAGKIAVKAGGQTREISIRTGSIHVE